MQQVRRASWDLFIGPNKVSAPCPLCNSNLISLDERCGFEAAHIVPSCYMKMQKEIETTALHVVPSCRQCNNDCSNTNLLDFLWVRERYAALRFVMSRIHESYLNKFPDMSFENRVLWRILDLLFGRRTFPLGGFIQNAKNIYQIATEMQFAQLSQQALELAQKQKEVALQLEILLLKQTL